MKKSQVIATGWSTLVAKPKEPPKESAMAAAARTLAARQTQGRLAAIASAPDLGAALRLFLKMPELRGASRALGHTALAVVLVSGKGKSEETSIGRRVKQYHRLGLDYANGDKPGLRLWINDDYSVSKPGAESPQFRNIRGGREVHLSGIALRGELARIEDVSEAFPKLTPQGVAVAARKLMQYAGKLPADS